MPDTNPFFSKDGLQNLQDMGEIDFQQNILDIFFKTARDYLQKTLTAIQEKNFSAVHFSAHSLKGAALGVGAGYISRKIHLVEKESEAEENLDRVKGLIKYLNHWEPIIRNTDPSKYTDFIEEIDYGK